MCVFPWEKSIQNKHLYFVVDISIFCPGKALIYTYRINISLI